MKILSIDTSQKFTHLSLQTDEQVYTYTSDSFVPHSKTLMCDIDNLLKKADSSVSQLDAISVVVGPGSFTGCRLSVSIVKGLVYPHNIKIIPITALELLKFNHQKSIAIIKGIAKEVFVLNGKKMYLSTEEELQKEITDEILISYDTDNYSILSPQKVPYSVENLAKLAHDKYLKNEFTDILSLSPIYLRECQAEIDLKRKLNG